MIANPNKSVFDELCISSGDIGLLIVSPHLFAVKKTYECTKKNYMQTKRRSASIEKSYKKTASHDKKAARC